MLETALIKRPRDTTVGGCPVANPARSLLGSAEHERADRGRAGDRGCFEKVIHPFAALRQEAAQLPEAPQVGGQIESHLEVAGRPQLVERSWEVVVVRGEAIEPAAALRAVELLLRLARKIAIGRGVAGHDRWPLATFVEQLAAVGTHGLEEPEAVAPRRTVASRDKAAVHQRLEHLDGIRDRRVHRGDRLDLGQLRATGED